MVVQAGLRSDLSMLEGVANGIAREMAFARVYDSDVMIHTPLSFPSGRTIGLKILGGPAQFTITDDGAAFREAEMLGAEDIFRREARRVAEHYELRFNTWELFEADAPLETLAGHAGIVANAASLAMIRTADRFAESFSLRRKEDLALKLSRIYGKAKVAKDVELPGASAKMWKFDAQVALSSGRMGLFALVMPSPASVAFAYSKFDDVSRLDSPPFLAAVLSGDLDPADKSLLSRAARKLIGVNDNDDVFRLAA